MKRSLIPIVCLSFFLGACQSENPYKNAKSAIRVAFNKEPTTLDPRKGTDLHTANVLQMVYEGLMRLDYHGDVTRGVAEIVDVSPDLKTYTFHLRDTIWSDGTKLTASDFADTWISSLSPSHPSPNANHFYYIKNAKSYQEGVAHKDDVGIKVIDSKTLVVELENPLPYFLKLVSTYFYLPTHIEMRKGINTNIVSNGPYKLKDWKHQDELVLEKNNLYWDAKVVSVDHLIFPILDESTALKLYEQGQIDHTGSPTSTLPQDAMASLKKDHALKIQPAAGTYLFRFNTEQNPFNNVKLRKAFNAAINRKEIVDHITQGNQLPAKAMVPPLQNWKEKSYFEDNDVTKAWKLFQEGLNELNIDKDHFPEVTLTYTYSDRNHKIAQAVQQQWNKAFNLDVKLQSQESKVFSENVLKGRYQIALGSWFADFSDPISFLEIFSSKKNSSNRTNWENSEYAQLIHQSNLENSEDKRFDILRKAESILMEQLPIAPLFFASFNYIQTDEIGGVSLSDLGILDFKYAFIDKVENFNDTLQ
jgi:oligopeptide transport system substrate-binding protein